MMQKLGVIEITYIFVLFSLSNNLLKVSLTTKRSSLTKLMSFGWNLEMVLCRMVNSLGFGHTIESLSNI